MRWTLLAILAGVSAMLIFNTSEPAPGLPDVATHTATR